MTMQRSVLGIVASILAVAAIVAVVTISPSILSARGDVELATTEKPDYTPKEWLKVKRSILQAEKTNIVGYLRKGDSLPGMPLDFGMGKAMDGSELGAKCENACKDDGKCKAYTYHPAQGSCYLKSAVRPGLRGDSCVNGSCWYFGVLSDRI